MLLRAGVGVGGDPSSHLPADGFTNLVTKSGITEQVCQILQ